MSGPLQNPFMFNSAAAGDFYEYQIANSCRFDRASSHYLNRTIQSGGNLDLWTLSFWMKLTASAGFGSNQYHVYTSEDNTIGAYDAILFDVNASSQIYYQISNKYFVGNHSIRDTSAWYHVVIVFDSGNGTAAHRKRVWFNNVEDTGSDVQTYTQNLDSQLNKNTVHNIGARQDENASYFFDGYLADFIFVDGYAYAPTYFGESKNGCWIPKDYKTDTGNYGTTGYHLDFANSAALGNDVSGNNNDWTVHNLSAHDQMKDTPTFDGSSNGGNFCTMNPLGQQGGGADTYTFAEGNLQVAGSSMTAVGTMGITSGKWYYEAVMTSGDSGSIFGWTNQQFNTNTELCYNNPSSGADVQCFGTYMEGGGGDSDKVVIMTDVGDGSNHTDSSIADSKWSTNDIIGVAFDADNKKVWFSKNGDWDFAYASSDPATAASPMIAASSSMRDYTIKMDRPWLPAVGNWSGASRTYKFNFGTDSSFSGSKTSGSANAADDTGYGDFYYDVPAGFLALCSGNLPTPAADPADDEGPYKYFVPKLYTGNGTSISVSTGFQTDLVWVKYRDGTYDHTIGDSSRGTGKYIQSDTSAAEQSNVQSFTAFGSDGFTYGSELSGNQNTYPMISWNWKVNGGTTASNTTGDKTSTVQVDTDRGISIVQYTGNETAETIGHSLGAKPELIMVKCRSFDRSWAVQWVDVNNTTSYILNTTGSDASSGYWNNTSPTSSVFSVGGGTETNKDSQTFIAYCFVSKEGFSKVGTYEGNGNANGTFVCTGFRPAWIMTRSVDSTSDWQIFDELREGYNIDNDELVANSTAAETTTDYIDILSNGFKLRTTSDPNVAETYGYIAFAKNPFKYATAR